MPDIDKVDLGLIERCYIPIDAVKWQTRACAKWARTIGNRKLEVQDDDEILEAGLDAKRHISQFDVYNQTKQVPMFESRKLTNPTRIENYAGTANELPYTLVWARSLAENSSSSVWKATGWKSNTDDPCVIKSSKWKTLF